MNNGSLAEWLTLVVIYAWAGVWYVSQVGKHVGWDLEKRIEQFACLFCIFFWLPLSIVTLFIKDIRR